VGHSGIGVKYGQQKYHATQQENTISALLSSLANLSIYRDQYKNASDDGQRALNNCGLATPLQLHL